MAPLFHSTFIHKILVVVLGLLIMPQHSFACSPKSNLHLSKIYITKLLEDLGESYEVPSNGGIGKIKALSTHSYSATVLREKAVDEFNYRFSLNADCTVKIVKKTNKTLSVGSKPQGK